ncbi:MAG: deoxyribonuclease IV [Thermoplasmata archaeon]
MHLGAHLGIADGLDHAVTEAKRIGGDCLQIFAKSPQMWKGPPISDAAAAGFRTEVERVGLHATAVHHGYLLNLAHPLAERRTQSVTAFIDELGRAEKLGADALIFHPGAHLGSGSEEGVARIAESLNLAFDRTAGYRVRALLENSAGQGTTIGSRFEEIASVLAQVHDSRRVGVTLDTCHLFAAGFDFRGADGYAAMVDELSKTIGTERVHAFHLNDAKADVGSHLDRHENIGKGHIGLDGFRHLVNDPRWTHVPGYLETPLDDNDYARYVEDLATLRSLGARRTPAKRRRASTVK